MTPTPARRWRSERGSAAVEMVLLVPVLVTILMVIVFAGRVALARQTVQAAAADAARAASIARDAAQARRDATAIATRTLAAQGLTCARTSVTVNTSGFGVPVGQPAQVLVTVTCDVRASDLGLPGPATTRVEATHRSPLDTYRGRR